MKALAGIRVLELTHMLSGPYAGMILADLGAETIKIEPPGQGEMTRGLLANDPRYSRHGMGAYFLTLNRNKKSITINLKSEAGLALFYELVSVSDVVLNNFRVGVPERLKVSRPYLSEVNPRIITCTVSGFGETGPDGERPAYDMVAQAISGVMSITGQPGAPPTRAGIPIADFGGALLGVVGILAALTARERTGCGQHVDISMLDSQISMLSYYATIHLMAGEIPGQMGNAHFYHVPYDTYRCQDGYIILAVVTDDFWHNLMEIVALPDLDTEENRQRAGRLKNRATIDRRLGEVFASHPQSYWLEKLEAARIPCAPVNDVSQALADPQVLARNMVAEVAYPQGGRVRIPGNPVKLSETHEDMYTPAPLLGQHNEQVFGELLGKSVEEITELRAAGAI